MSTSSNTSRSSSAVKIPLQRTESRHRQNFLTVSQRLLDPKVKENELLQLVTDIRERIEIVHSSEYRNFLQFYMPAFEHILTTRVPPQFHVNHLNKLRHNVLEILNRLPSNDYLTQYIDKLILLVMHIMEVDNEENALICVRILFALHKNFRPKLKKYVPRFLTFVQKLYKNLENTKNFIFPIQNHKNAAVAIASTPMHNTAASTTTPTILLKSTNSFKVLTECPLIVMLLFQLYADYVAKYVEIFIPLMTSGLKLLPPPISIHIQNSTKLLEEFQTR
jgi:transformation/transcription domain-associated protein|tara:strand:- start:25 stop:858 length:834 start_codon:yes stop_codon:yes gene_type:complete